MYDPATGPYPASLGGGRTVPNVVTGNAWGCYMNDDNEVYQDARCVLTHLFAGLYWHGSLHLRINRMSLSYCPQAPAGSRLQASQPDAIAARSFMSTRQSPLVSPEIGAVQFATEEPSNWTAKTALLPDRLSS